MCIAYTLEMQAGMRINIKTHTYLKNSCCIISKYYFCQLKYKLHIAKHVIEK